MALHRYRLAKPKHGSQDWLNLRFWDDNHNKRVSASEAAAIYGLHPFLKKDAYVARMMADQPPAPLPPNQAMDRGNRLEHVMLKWASDLTGVDYTEPTEMFFCDSPNGARLVSTLDGYWESGDERKILEIKTSTRKWEGILPDYWRIQGTQQAICADVDRVTWAVFDSTMNVHIHEQIVTPAEQAEHISAVESFLNSIELGMTPSGVRWSYESVQARHNKPISKIQELDETKQELFDRLRHVRSELESYKAMEDDLKAQICDLIGECDTAVIGNTTVATWKPQVRESLDAKAFRADHPELAAKYTKQTTTRVFLLKGENNGK